MELNQKNTRKIILIVVMGIVIYWALQNIGIIWNALSTLINILSPFILGIGIAFILNVIVNLIENKCFKGKGKNKKQKSNKILQKLKRPISILLSILILVAIIFFVLFMVIPELINTVKSLATYIPEIAKNLQNWIFDMIDTYPQVNDIITNINFDWNSIDEQTMQLLQNWAGGILSSSVNILISITSGITNFVIALIFAIYILLQKEKLGEQFKKLIKAYLPENLMNKTLKICTVSNSVFTKFITGQVTEAFILGFLCFIGMLILRMPYALTISVLIGFTALIPIFGAFIGAAIGFLLIAVQNPMLAVGFIIFIIILQQIEGNVIYPKVVGNSVGLPGIWVLVAVTVGGALWGIPGIAISVPLASILYALIREGVENRLREKEKIKEEFIC